MWLRLAVVEEEEQVKMKQEREAGCGSGGESGGGGGGSSVGASDFRLLFCCVNVALMLSCCLHYLLVNRVRLENQLCAVLKQL